MNAIVKFQPVPVALALRKPQAMGQLKAQLEPCRQIWHELLSPTSRTVEQTAKAIERASALVASPQFGALDRQYREASRPATVEEIATNVALLASYLSLRDMSKVDLVTDALCQDLLEEGITAVALEAGCRIIRTTKTWLVPAELFAAITAAQKDLDETFYTVRNFPRAIKEQTAELENEKRYLEARLAEQAAMKLAAAEKAEHDRIVAIASPIAQARFIAHLEEFAPEIEAAWDDMAKVREIQLRRKTLRHFLDEEIAALMNGPKCPIAA
jgi:hypothetical protein